MDDVRRILVEIREDEARLDRVRQREARRRWRWTMLIFVAGALAFVLVVGAVWSRQRDADARRRSAEEGARAQELLRQAVQAAPIGMITRSGTAGLRSPARRSRGCSAIRARS